MNTKAEISVRCSFVPDTNSRYVDCRQDTSHGEIEGEFLLYFSVEDGQSQSLSLSQECHIYQTSHLGIGFQ